MVPLSFTPLEFAGQTFHALPHDALFWPEEAMVIVADMHLEKGSWYAQTGQMLPPYDSVATLSRLVSAVKQTGARTVMCLGDNFHDNAGVQRITGEAAVHLSALADIADIIWITGNHDAALDMPWGGRVVADMELKGIDFCHEADKQRSNAQMCGHFHPKLRLRQRGRMVSRRCYVRTSDLLILPAFGALTGGLDCSHEAIASLCDGQCAEALVPVRDHLVVLPVAQLTAVG